MGRIYCWCIRGSLRAHGTLRAHGDASHRMGMLRKIVGGRGSGVWFYDWQYMHFRFFYLLRLNKVQLSCTLIEFERLEVWQIATDFTKDIYLVTREFPDEERFGLISQLRRAAVSIGSNISEGTGRETIKDQKYFYQVAYGSLMEVLNQLILSNQLGYIEDDVMTNLLRPKGEKVSRMLFGLIKSLKE